MTARTAVLGCGLMGSAVARALVRSPGSTHAWNRSPAKAEQLRSHGVIPSPTSAGAIEGSDVVFTLLADYATARAVLERADTWPEDTTLVNLITGSPADARAMSTWAASRGIPYLDGAILAYPADIGNADTMIVCSGDPTLWARHADVLLGLGGASVHVGEAIDAGNTYDVAVAGAFFNVALGGFVEAAAFARAAGLSAKAMRPGVDVLIELLRREIDIATEGIDAGDFDTDQATIDVYAHATRSWADTVMAGGQRASLLRAAVENLEFAQAAGNGSKAFSAQVLSAGESNPT